MAAPAPRAWFATAAGRKICPDQARPWLLAAAILASALGFIDGSVVAVAMPAMRAALDADLSAAQWISNAYLLTLSALILAGGGLADRLGLVRVFGFGIVVFMVASLLCAIAPTAGFLIGARALKGVGAALMIPGSLALIARIYPPDLRGKAIGIWAAASAITTALGPIAGGLALSLGGDGVWRVIFAVNLPLGALALWLLARFTSAETERTGGPVDWRGAGLATVALGLLAWALTGEGADVGRSALAAAGIGAAVLVLFVVHEGRTAHPMMPLGLFANRAFSAANIVTFLLYFALSAVLFFLPMGMIGGWQLPEALAGLAFVPLTVGVAVLSGPAGALADRYGPRAPILAGTLMTAAAFLGLAVTAPWQAFWGATLPCLVLMGVGMGVLVAPLSAAVMAAVPETATGSASGINNAISRIAGLVAVASLGGAAAAAYGAADGPATFGIRAAEDMAAAHADASNAALALICGVGAVSAAFAALAAAVGLPVGAAAADDG